MFIDAIAGGGGIITIPSYLFVGLPITTAYGTNKVVSSIGTAFSAGNYIRSGCVNWTMAVPALCGSLIGSWFGAQLTLHLSQDILQIILMIVLPVVAVLMLFNRGFGEVKTEKPVRSFWTAVFLALLIGLVLGCYDGFFGPGTGMFLTLAFVLIERLDLIHGAGTTKVVNLASNVGAAVAYVRAGTVEYKVLLPCIICSVAGSLLGSQFAIKKGSKFIKTVLAIAAVLLMIKVFAGFIQN